MWKPTLSRKALLTAAAAASVGSPPAGIIQPCIADSLSLSARLARRDAAALAKPQSGLTRPVEAAFPDWLEGDWLASMAFDGYELPSKDVISREELFSEANVPGFQKCSLICAQATPPPQISPIQYIENKFLVFVF